MSHRRLPRAGFAEECDRSAVQQLLESHLRVVRKTDVSELVRGYAVPFLVGPETALDVEGRSAASYNGRGVLIEFVSRHVFPSEIWVFLDRQLQLSDFSESALPGHPN
jgi:hypothetical protein